MARKKATPAPLIAQAPKPEIGLVHPDQHRIDVDPLRMLQRLLSKNPSGRVNPVWNDEEELEWMVAAGTASADSVDKLLSFQMAALPTGNANINDRFAKRHTVADLNIPRNPIAMMQLSQRYACENPFVNKAAQIKTNFTCKDFKHKTHKSSARDFYDQLALDLHLYTVLPKIVWTLYTIGIVPIYWGGEDGGPIKWLQVFNPVQCHFEEILGKQRLYVKIDAKMIAAVKDPTGKDDPRNKDLFESMPKYWISYIQEAIKKSDAKGMIPLQEGSYCVLENRFLPYNRAINTLDGVPLQAAFDALQRYRLIAAGDFAVAWGIKNMITIISEGDPKVDPKNYTPLDQKRLNMLMSTFLNPDYSLTVCADPTTNIRYFVPPIEVFDPKKYSQCEKEIKTVMGLPSYMFDTEGNGTFGAAVAETQILVQEVERIRIILREQFFRPLYVRARQGATRPGFAAKDIPLPEFDKKSLKDNVTYLAAIEQGFATGAISWETYLETMDIDPEYEMKQKEVEHEKYGNTSDDSITLNNTIARPLFEPSQGSIKEKEPAEPGRPSSGKGNPAASKKRGAPRAPRTSGK